MDFETRNKATAVVNAGENLSVIPNPTEATAAKLESRA